MPKTSQASLKAIANYQKRTFRYVKLNLHKTLDADILEKLESVESKQGYIKDLIRADIAKNK